MARETEEPNANSRTNRLSMNPGEPSSAPELVAFINCTTLEDIQEKTPEQLLVAAQQGNATLADWEVTIVTHLQRIQDLEDELTAKQSVIHYFESRTERRTASPSPTPSHMHKSTKLPDLEVFTGNGEP